MTIYFSWLTAPYGAFFMYSNLNPGLSASLEKSLKKFYPDFYVLKFKPRFERVSGKKFKKVLPRFLGFKLIGDIYITLKNRAICQQIKHLSQCNVSSVTRL